MVRLDRDFYLTFDLLLRTADDNHLAQDYSQSSLKNDGPVLMITYHKINYSQTQLIG